MLLGDDNPLGEAPVEALFRIRKTRAKETERIEKAENIFTNLFGKHNPFWDRKDNLARTFSYGQQRLIGLARLFMGSYELLLLDEPTAGINPAIVAQTINIIRRFVSQSKATVFLIEHNMQVVLEIADFCCFMSEGKIAAVGTPEDVIGNDEVRKTYLGL